VAISQLESEQIGEFRKFLDGSSERERFEGIEEENILEGVVSPSHYGDFPEDGHVVLEVHGNRGKPDHFERLNRRLEGSEEGFRPYAIDTREPSPDIDGYLEDLDDAYARLKQEEGFEEFSIVMHSLGCVGGLKWIHERDLYDEVDKFVASAGPFKGVAAADLAERVDRPMDIAESSAKLMTAFNPFLDGDDIEKVFENYKLDSVSDSYVSRRSAEEGGLADLMDETEITESAETHTIRSSIDRWYGPLENTLPLGYEGLTSLVPYGNRLDSPAIQGADGNLVLPSSTHHQAIEGEMAVEYTGRVLEEYESNVY